jgi:glycerol-3-phosphate dehydrogenase
VFAGSEALESSYFLTRSKALEAFPMLKKDELVGALVYYDGKNTIYKEEEKTERIS